MHDKRVGICIDTRRYRCQACAKTFVEPLPALAENRMMTERLAKWIGRQSLKHIFRPLAEETGVVEGTIRNIFRDYINEPEKTVRFETPRWMGIDEIHLIKPRCVISNIANNTLVDLLPNRNKETVVRGSVYELETGRHARGVGCLSRPDIATLVRMIEAGEL